MRLEPRRPSVVCVALLLGGAAVLPPRASRAQDSPAGRLMTGWRVTGRSLDAYAVDTVGRPTDPAAAAVVIRPREPGRRTPGGVANAIFSMLADTLRGRRVRVSGEIRTRAVAAPGAAVGLRLATPGGEILLSENTLDDAAVRGTSDWTRREVSVYVPADAARVAAVFTTDDGEAAEVRGLRLEALPADAPMAPEARAELDSAIAVVRRRALWRDTVTWAVVEPQVRAMAAGARRPSEVYQAIRALLRSLGDHHSFLMTAREAAAWQTAGADGPAPVVRALPAGVGYVWVPGYRGNEPGAQRAYAQRLHGAFAGVASAARCGWVVDLRANTGGNMHPMLAGLKPFLGPRPVLGWRETVADSAPARATVVAGTDVGAEPPVALAPMEQAHVAVLTGGWTGSSGEMVTLAFRGRPRTRSFGAPTHGLTQANAGAGLPDGARMLLTTAFSVDRTGAVYGGKVEPDVPLPGLTPAAPDTAPPPPGAPDPVLEAATSWLRQASGCARAGAPTEGRRP